MFEQTFVDGVGKTSKGWTVVVSFAGQIGIILVAVVLPMIYFDALPKGQLTSFLVAPPPPPPPAPPPAAAPEVKVVKVIPRQFDAGKLLAPKSVPKDVAIITEEALPPPTTAGVAGGIGSALTNAGSLLGGIIGGAPVAAAPPPQAKKQEVVRQKIGGNVIMANLINKVPPVYPPLAKQARIQGQVKLKAIISTSGTIQQLELISGHPLLVPAAMAAVRQWTYKPTLLNGEPVEVETQVDVNFALN